MRIRTEITDSLVEEEIVIRCKVCSERTTRLEEAIETALRGENELMLTVGTDEHFVPKNRILFFESSNGKVYAQTADKTYVAPYRLCELEALLPVSFARISKSAIANVMQVSSLRRELVGNGELSFRGCEKKVYFSRAYYKLLQYKIEEMRLRK